MTDMTECYDTDAKFRAQVNHLRLTTCIETKGAKRVGMRQSRFNRFEFEDVYEVDGKRGTAFEFALQGMFYFYTVRDKHSRHAHELGYFAKQQVAEFTIESGDFIPTN